MQVVEWQGRGERSKKREQHATKERRRPSAASPKAALALASDEQSGAAGEAGSPDDQSGAAGEAGSPDKQSGAAGEEQFSVAEEAGEADSLLAE
jgi:hypothetical protein